MAKDYYATLGVDRNATQDDVKKAFRKLAQKHHPDKGGDEAKFKEITEAYATLSDDKKRKQYDMYGQSGPAGGGAGAGGYGAGFDWSQFTGGFGQGGVEFDLNDLFGDAFGGGGRRQAKARGRDISVDIDATFKESILGAQKTVRIAKVAQCDSCKGSGAKHGTAFDECKTCKGSGRISEMRRTVFGQFSNTRVCDDCTGAGKIPKEKCSICNGRGVMRKEEEIKFSIPAGIENGETLRVSGQGEAMKGAASGDLYIQVRVKPHAVFRKEGHNLAMDLSLKLSDALLGTTVSITTIDDKEIEVKVPPLTEPVQLLRIKEKGVPTRGGRGDLFITVTVAMPKKLSSRAKKAIEELKEEGL